MNSTNRKKSPVVASKHLPWMHATLKVCQYGSDYKLILVYMDKPVAWNMVANIDKRQKALDLMEEYYERFRKARTATATV